MEYYIEDFTEENYRNLIQIAKENNKICSYEEAIKGDNGIVFRHDIDFSVHRAVALSKIEKMEGVQSTFFVHLHSQCYNVLEKEITDLLKEIIKNNGIIGLHFEPGYYGLNIEDISLLNKKALFEKQVLEEILHTKINYLSFHNPDVGGDWYKLDDLKIGDMWNVYGKVFREQFEYCSDSNGYWRFKRLQDVLLDSKGKKIHVLTHPVWWQKNPMYPYDRIRRCIDCRAKNNLNSYNELLEKIGRTNVKGK